MKKILKSPKPSHPLDPSLKAFSKEQVAFLSNLFFPATQSRKSRSRRNERLANHRNEGCMAFFAIIMTFIARRLGGAAKPIKTIQNRS
jgi:hypothetical protein